MVTFLFGPFGELVEYCIDLIKVLNETETKNEHGSLGVSWLGFPNHVGSWLVDNSACCYRSSVLLGGTAFNQLCTLWLPVFTRNLTRNLSTYSSVCSSDLHRSFARSSPRGFEGLLIINKGIQELSVNWCGLFVPKKFGACRFLELPQLVRFISEK